MSTFEHAELGARLRSRRRIALLTQRELAAQLGIARSTIAALENGDGSRPISHRILGKLDRWLKGEEAPNADVACSKCGTRYEVRLVPRE